jgi:hypothetical protein
MHKTVILPVLCVTLSLTLIDVYRFRVFENRVLKRIFGQKREGVNSRLEKVS